MSGPPLATSSGAAEGREEALVVGDDALDRGGLGSRAPLIELERAAEDDPVGPGEHVAGAAGERVAHLRLRLEDGELAARRAQVRIAEQVAAAEARAVEHQLLGKRHDIAGRRELADL